MEMFALKGTADAHGRTHTGRAGGAAACVSRACWRGHSLARRMPRLVRGAQRLVWTSV